VIYNISIPLSGGNEMKVVCDTSLAANEIRVGSLNVLDRFIGVVEQKQGATARISELDLNTVLDESDHGRNVRVEPRVQIVNRRTNVLRLSDSEIHRAYVWLSEYESNLTEEDREVMRVFFPAGGKTMATSPVVHGICESRNWDVGHTRNRRNEILRHAGILTR
jgi:hypothetical protein